MKCIKCGIRFKYRKVPEEKNLVDRELCFNCGMIWNYIKMSLQAIGRFEKINRVVIIKLEDIKIVKKRRLTNPQPQEAGEKR